MPQSAHECAASAVSDADPVTAAAADFAAALAETPSRARARHIHALRENGLSDEEIVDLSNAVAMFAWANRLMLTLGEPTPAPAA